MVLDMHCFMRNRRVNQVTDFDLIFGTDYRQTVLYEEPDRELGLYLQKSGYSVFVPEKKDSLPGGDPFRSGFISKYLSWKHEVNTLQIEIERRFRSKDSTNEGVRLAKTLAEWLAVTSK